MCDRYLVGWLLVLSTGVNAQQRGDYRQADSVAYVYAGHTLHDLPGLAFKLTQPFESDVDKFRAIYTWTCLNIDNDYQLFLKNKYKRERFASDPDKLEQWNVTFNRIMFRQLRQNKRTTCTGYAYLIRELARHAGLKCVMIDGYSRSGQTNVGRLRVPSHTWNAIRLNNTWYLCDATWSSGVINGATQTFQKQYDDVYFMAEPALFARNHYPLDTAWLLLKQKPTLKQFVSRPVIYKSLYRHQISNVNPDTLSLIARKDELLRINFQTAYGNDEMKVELQIKTDKSDSGIMRPFTYRSGFYQVEHTFRSKGYYTVHALINGEYAISYEVRVED